MMLRGNATGMTAFPPCCGPWSACSPIHASIRSMGAQMDINWLRGRLPSIRLGHRLRRPQRRFSSVLGVFNELVWDHRGRVFSARRKEQLGNLRPSESQRPEWMDKRISRHQTRSLFFVHKPDRSCFDYERTVAICVQSQHPATR
jgi:hypothetical protein